MRFRYPQCLSICRAYCPTEEEPPQMRIASFAWGGAAVGTGQGRGSSRSVVTAWKTVTKLFPSVTASWSVKPTRS